MMLDNPERMASMASRFLPLASVLTLLAIACILRPAIQRWRHGTLGINIFNSRRQDRNLRDLLLIAMFAALIVQGLVATQRVRWMAEVLVWSGPVHAMLQPAGVVLITSGLIVFALAEIQMGASWRIGIEEGAKPGLVTHGLYRYSRNPIYFALLVVLAGYAALLPTPLSIAMLVATCIGLRVQVTHEEDYLLRTYGEEFRNYARQVGRFAPRLSALGLRLSTKSRTASDAITLPQSRGRGRSV